MAKSKKTPEQRKAEQDARIEAYLDRLIEAAPSPEEMSPERRERLRYLWSLGR